jgi:hypothetical protein
VVTDKTQTVNVSLAKASTADTIRSRVMPCALGAVGGTVAPGSGKESTAALSIISNPYWWPETTTSVCGWAVIVVVCVEAVGGLILDRLALGIHLDRWLGQSRFGLERSPASYGRNLWMSLSHESAAYLPP